MYDGYVRVYADRSKDVASAVTDDKSVVLQLPDHTPIFSAEAKAVPLALDIADSRMTKELLFFRTISPVYRAH